MHLLWEAIRQPWRNAATCRTKQKVNNKGCRCGEGQDKAKKANRVQYGVSYYPPGWKNRRETKVDPIRKRKDQDAHQRFGEVL